MILALVLGLACTVSFGAKAAYENEISCSLFRRRNERHISRSVDGRENVSLLEEDIENRSSR